MADAKGPGDQLVFRIVICCLVATLISLQGEGTFSFRKAWLHKPEPGGLTDDVVSEPHKLPPPVVADLNGDGHFEVILATQDLTLQVVQPAAAARQGGGFAPAHLLAQVSLLYKRTFVTASRRPVAMAVGYLDPMPVERVRAARRQVLVVVTASWQVLCFDHNLKLLWEQDVRIKFPHHSHIKEVALHVGPHQVRKGDRGLVVVGASLESGDVLSGEGMEGGFADDDVLLEETRTEYGEAMHDKSAGANEQLQDVEAGGGGTAVSRHFTYYALEGGKGEERWHHKSEDFHRDLSKLAGEMQPQSNYKLEAEKLEGRHYGEASCRDYRESMMHVLPHSWTHPQDTWLQPAHFLKHREARGAQRSSLANQGPGTPKGHTKATSMARAGSVHTGSWFSRKGPQTTHGKAGPPTGGAAVAPHNRHHHAHHSNMTVNVLVAHLEEGMEVVHLFSGRTICKLHLAPGTLHADINGDGVIDHVQVYHGTTAEGEDTDMDDNTHHPASHCMATARSGIPPRERLFSINVCRTSRFASGIAGGSGVAAILEDEDVGHEATELATPVMLPLPQLSGYRSHSSQHGLLVFATNKGQLTAVNARGQHVWQNFFPTAWPHSAAQEGQEVKVVPTLSVMALHSHAVPTTILAAGTEAAVLVSEHGHLLDSLWLPAPPVQPLIVVDFNGDGLNDVILVTNEGIFGYSQVQHYGGFTLSALLGCLIIALAVVFYTQQPLAADGRNRTSRKLRSTEYVD